ncbi:MAG: hypothetical protein AB7N76_22560 [Planctomycetota bacterium]
MADLDPKELAKRNIPLIVIYLVALLPIPLWFALVQGQIRAGKTKSVADAISKLKRKQSTVKTFADRVKRNDPDLFTPQHVEAFNKRAEALKTQVAALEDLIRKRDENLEKWFDDAQFNNLKEGQSPDHADYTQYWKSKAIPQLLETYKELVMAEGATDPYLYATPPAKDMMRRDQKRFWAQKYILEAITTGAKHGITLQEGKQIKARLQSAITFGASTDDKRGPNDPKPLVSSFRATVDLLCSFRDVGLIARELLAQPIPLQIVNLEVAKHPFRLEDRKLQLTVDGSEKVFQDDNFSIKLDGPELFKGDDKLEEYVPEPPVRLALEVDVLDFELPKAAPKPAEQPAEGQ